MGIKLNEKLDKIKPVASQYEPHEIKEIPFTVTQEIIEGLEKMKVEFEKKRDELQEGINLCDDTIRQLKEWVDKEE